MSPPARRRWTPKLTTRLATHLPARLALQLQYARQFGRLANLDSPSLFTELIQLRKLRDTDGEIVACSDKILVKDYVRKTLGPQWVIPTLWTGTSFPKSSDWTWATPFVLKANFGSGRNHVVLSCDQAEEHLLQVLAQKWVGERYAPHLKERYQDRIVRRLLVEPYIGPANELPIDYKLYCFGGRVECILVCTGRSSELKTAVFSRDWKELDLEFTEQKPHPPPEAPISLDQLVAAAETLSKHIDFVRIDFYEVGGKPLFGEYTFTPSSGFRRLRPAAYDARFGRLWREARISQQKERLSPTADGRA